MSLIRQFFGLEPGAAQQSGMVNNFSSGTADPSQWLTDLFGGMVTQSGINVTPRLAMTVPGVAACVNVLAEDIAKIPVHLYKRSKDRKTKTLATDHPLFHRLNEYPAPWLSSYMWRRALVAAAMTRGNGYARVNRDSRGQVDTLINIKPGRAVVRWTAESEPFYDVMDGSIRTTLGWQDVIHLAYRPDADAAVYGGVVGVSPIARHPEAIALCVAAERFAAAFFRNGARPSAVIEMEGKLPKDEVANRIRASIERTYAGLDNAFKIAILELGMKLKEFSFNNADSQLVEVRKEAAVTMCQIFGVPPHKVGILDKATFSNIEHQAIEYVTGPISSLARALESSIAIACLTEKEREDYYIELQLNGLLRGDIQSRYRAYAIGRQWGWLSADDVRELESLDPLPDEQGKIYLTPANMQDAANPDPVNDPAPDQPAPPGQAPASPPKRQTQRKRSALVGVVGEPLFLPEDDDA